MLLQVSILLLAVAVGAEAQEERIRAYGSRVNNRTIVRIIPSGGSVIRVRKPDQARPGSVLTRESTITMLQPVLVAPKAPPRVDVGSVLLGMRLRSMASLIARTKLQQYLQHQGPVTLFAPTDEAFSLATPPSDPSRLRDFVLQHVVRGRVTPQDIRNDVTTPSLRSGGRPLRFNVYEDGQMLSVSGSQFLDDATDAGSVRIQPIDRVLYPISKEDLVTETRLTFPHMFQSLLNTSLTPQLTSGTFTLFAPTDAAFEALAPDVRQQLFQNPSLLRKVLLNHIVPGTHYSAVLAHGYILRTLGGESIRFTNRRGLILANGVPLVKSDISVVNGVIHALNRYLLPPELNPQRRPATIAPPPGRTPAPALPHQSYKPPVKVYYEPPPSVPRTLTKTMVTPLRLPDGRNETFSTANNLFRRSLLLSTIRNNGQEGYTIVMPTDGAFNALEPGSLDRLRRNTRLLRRMLQYQMLEGKLNVSSLNGQDKPVQSMGGTIIISSLDNGKSLMAGGARVLSIRSADNGLVLVTDKVIFPPPARTVAEALAPITTLKSVVDRQPAVQSLLSSVILMNGLPPSSSIHNKRGLASRVTTNAGLAGEATYTIFAPSDEALSRLPPEQRRDPKFLSELFWSHVVPGAYYRSRLAPGLQLTTLRGFTITVHRTPEDVLVNDVPLEGEEILAGNGVIHKLDHVLFTPRIAILPQFAPVVEPEDNLAKIARQFNATQFLDWLKRAHMRNILQNQVARSGGCTLFLPTDTALNGMSPTLRSATLGDVGRLRKFVLFHVSPRTLYWDSVRDNALLPTLLPGKQLRCNVYAREKQPGVLSFSGCRVSAMQPLDSTGNVTVAVIEGTMSPPHGKLPLVVSKSPFLTNFSKILKVAGAEDMWVEGGPYTVFAPDACVFTKMSPHKYQQLISNKKVAREFVKRYLVLGCYYTSGLYDGQTLITEAGTELHVNVTPECILVSGVKVLYGDMNADDGVLHILEGQLLT